MSNPLDFTGERFTPECVREIWYEHWHRYAFARKFVAGKRVLDAACGEGYGSRLLSDVAGDVIGVDLSAEAVMHARTRYGDRANLRFIQADATVLDLPDNSVDVVVSFETLEHLRDQDALLAGFARVLSDDGVLLISSPDKHTYSDLTGHSNEFHVRELYRPELEALLSRHFPQFHLYGQKLLFQSALWALDGEGGERLDCTTATQADAGLVDGLAYAPLYYIAVCFKGQPHRTMLPRLSLFGDREESVYSHYNHEIRKNMAAGARIAELEAELDRLRAVVDHHSPIPRNVPD